MVKITLPKAGMGLGCVLLVVFVIALIAFMPLLLIWSVNTLFGLAIPFTWKTWFAMLAVSAVVSGSAGRGGSS